MVLIQKNEFSVSIQSLQHPTQHPKLGWFIKQQSIRLGGEWVAQKSRMKQEQDKERTMLWVQMKSHSDRFAFGLIQEAFDCLLHYAMQTNGMVPWLPLLLDPTNDGLKYFYIFNPMLSWLAALTAQHANADAAYCATSLLMLLLVDCCYSNKSPVTIVIAATVIPG